MRCQKCGKKIISGLFRYWESKNREAYLSEHKNCSLQDIEWARIDKVQAERIDYNKKLLQSAIEFKGKWGIQDLDELIEELTND